MRACLIGSRFVFSQRRYEVNSPLYFNIEALKPNSGAIQTKDFGKDQCKRVAHQLFQILKSLNSSQRRLLQCLLSFLWCQTDCSLDPIGSMGAYVEDSNRKSPA
jgi:hypothetical protein